MRMQCKCNANALRMPTQCGAMRITCTYTRAYNATERDAPQCNAIPRRAMSRQFVYCNLNDDPGA
eukprot:5701781-Lingulodinium_polyedra.AAC.1